MQAKNGAIGYSQKFGRIRSTQVATTRQVLGGGIAHTKDAPMPRPRRHRWWPFAHPLVFEHFVEFSVTAVAPARRALQSSDNRELNLWAVCRIGKPDR